MSAIESIQADRLLDFRPAVDMWWEITKPAVETEGEYLETINHIGPSRGGPPVHLHQTAAETFDVVEGRLGVLMDGSWTALHPGEAITVPAGTPHTVDNRSGEPVVFVNTHRPALRFEQMFREMHALADAGKLTLPPRNPRAMIYGAMLFVKYKNEQRVIKPPQAVFNTIARLGRTLGLRLDGTVTSTHSAR
ncbi:MAG TPA: cupin domain-containing protein [Thermoleophilaceae bacterium]|jgi:mannose-6-phosphate isomerase-like protein (cupin superfamily)